MKRLSQKEAGAYYTPDGVVASRRVLERGFHPDDITPNPPAPGILPLSCFQCL
jgi:hypothetical protein